MNNLKNLRSLLLACLLVLLSSGLFSQPETDVPATGEYAVISNITLVGNNKTRDKIVLREMDVAIGDTLLIEEIAKTLNRNRQYIFNTSLFQKVDLNIKNWDTIEKTLDIEVTVLEDWYIYPIPIFALADRNFNVWIKEFNASLKRTSYGMRFYHFNLTGNADRLRVLTQFGYTKRFEVGYNRPNINKSQTLGWNNTVSFQSRKEVNYITEDNKQIFYRNEEEDQFQSFRLRSVLTYRPKINQYQSLTLEYFNNSVADTISQILNPAYYNAPDGKQRYFRLRYAYRNDQRNFRTYPTKGSFFQFLLTKDGLGISDDIDLFKVESTYAKYISLTEKLSLEGFLKFSYSINRQQPPYANYRAIGFSPNTLRGYELYVIDAMDFAIFKSSVRYKIWDTQFKFGKIMPFESFKTLPIQLLLTFNNDLGYANDPFFNALNPLGNQWLWGGGIGLDLILYNDYVFQVEYNLNQLSEKGLFLKVKLPF